VADSSELTALTLSPDSKRLRLLLEEKRNGIEALMAEYDAVEPRLFGSAARGDANLDSDIDLFVRFKPTGENILWRAAGLVEDLRELLGVSVDLFSAELMKKPIAEVAQQEAIAL
jgi:predicted nucleotidyltransferase